METTLSLSYKYFQNIMTCDYYFKMHKTMVLKIQIDSLGSCFTISDIKQNKHNGKSLILVSALCTQLYSTSNVSILSLIWYYVINVRH